MPNVSLFGSPDSRILGGSSGLEQTIATNQGRTAANGNKPIIVERLRMWLSGAGATAQCTISLGNSSVTTNRASSGTPQDTGYLNSSDWFVFNGIIDATFKVTANSFFYAGRNSNSSLGSIFAGNQFADSGKMPFSYTYIESPTAPGNLSASSSSVGVASLSWSYPGDDGGDDVSGYRIEYSLNSNFSVSSIIDTGTSRSLQISNLTPASTYYFRVAAKNKVTNQAGTTSVFSGSTSVTIFGVPPSEPLNITATSDTPGEATITWSEPVFEGDSAVDGYQVQYSTTGSFSAQITTVTLGDVLSHTVTGLDFGTTYFFRVRAKNGAGYGLYSQEADVFIDGIAPTAPPSCNAISVTPGEANVSWGQPANDNGGAIIGYELDYSLESDFSSGVETINYSVTTSATVSALIQDETYYFRVRAINIYGTSTNSPTAQVQIFLDPNPRPFGVDNIGIKKPAFFSLAGHFAGFEEDGTLAASVETFKDYALRVNSPIAESFVVEETNLRGRKIYGRSVTGETLYFFRQTDTLSSLNTVRFKAFLNEENLQMSWIGNPRNPNRYSGQVVNLGIDFSTKILSLSVDYPVEDPNNPLQSVRDSESSSTSLSSIDFGEEIMVTVQYQRENLDGVNFEHKILVSVSQSGDADNAENLLTTYVTGRIDAATRPWTVNSNVRGLVTSNTALVLSENNVYDYEKQAPYSVQTDLPLYGPVPSVRKNLWDYLKEASAATNFEIASVSGDYVIRGVGERIVDVTNIIGSPSIEPSSTFTGRSVDIEHTNASIVSEGLFYYSREDDNRVLQINPGEIIVTTVQSKGSPNFIQQPLHLPIDDFLSYVENDFFPQSAYGIIDSTSLPITPAAWSARGGDVSVKISEEIPGALDVTLTAPGSVIPGTTPPYSVAYSDGQNNFGALALIGSGVITDVKTLNLKTGANEEKTQQKVSTTISNPFINTLEQAYDRGIWASQAAAGPIVELSGTIPTSSISGFGFAAGSLIFFKNNIYRIVEANISNVSVSFNAVSYVLVENFDEAWEGKTVGDHDDVWGESEIEDQTIFPFNYIEYNGPS